jgi:hypothetical protein
MTLRLLTLLATLPLLAPSVAAHDAAGSSDFDLIVPNMPLDGAITFVSLVGPASGAEVLHTTWNLTYTAPPGGTPAADVILELTMPLATGSVDCAISGADLGWPAATGTFSGSLGSDQLNGVLGGGLFGFTVPELVILSTTGGVTGKFIHSTITLELAGVCQQDLGFAGPGDVSLQVCGEVLATGGEATLSLDGAPAFADVLLVAGLGFAPTPFKGGTLVPVPILVAVPAAADSGGSLSLLVPGGGGPLSVYVQAIVVDTSQIHGIALSNVVQVELQP